MIPKDGLNVQYFLAALQRRFWSVVIPFFFIFIATVVYCIKAPRIYKSTSLILVQPQEVPSDYVRPTVTSDVLFRLTAITDEIMSRSRLEEVITKLNLYQEARAGGTLYNAVEKMRSKIKVNSKKSATYGAITSFEVSFEGEEPTTVRDVTAALADLFIQYNYKLRQEQAEGTSRFLDRELERMREELREKEKLVGQFRKQYSGMLPEETESNYRILAQLQQHLDSVNTTLQRTEDRKLQLRTHLSESEVGAGVYDLNQLKENLQKLRLRYSDRHPDIVRLEILIAKLENEQNSGLPRSNIDEDDFSRLSTTAKKKISGRQADLLNELKVIDKEIQTLQKEKEKTAERIETYSQRIENGPKVEQMFVDLRRDYQMASNNYQSLLQKKLQAELAENLERTQKGEQFKILDSANLPIKPYKPDIAKLLSMGLMLALGSGFGLAFIREYLDPTFWSRKEVEYMLDIPVLVSIPIITNEKEQGWKKIKLAASICALLVMSSTLLYALYVLWQKNPGFIPLPI